MPHTGLGRHGGIEEAAGDPLDGLVNLFDIGIVLAVAFLVAGLGVALESAARSDTPPAPRAAHTQTLPPLPAKAPRASGRGQPVGTVYRLSDGRLLYVAKPARGGR